MSFCSTTKTPVCGSISGEMLISSANDQGVQIKVGEGDYQRIPWANFTQEDLRRFAQNPKMQPLIEAAPRR